MLGAGESHPACGPSPQELQVCPECQKRPPGQHRVHKRPLGWKGGSWASTVPLSSLHLLPEGSHGSGQDGHSLSHNYFMFREGGGNHHHPIPSSSQAIPQEADSRPVLQSSPVLSAPCCDVRVCMHTLTPVAHSPPHTHTRRHGQKGGEVPGSPLPLIHSQESKAFPSSPMVPPQETEISLQLGFPG